MRLSLSALSVIGACGMQQCQTAGNLWQTVWPVQVDPTNQFLLLVQTRLVPGNTVSLDLSVDQPWACATAVVLSSNQYQDFLSEVAAGRTDVGRYQAAFWRQPFCGSLHVDVPISTWYPVVCHIGLFNLDRQFMWVRGNVSFDGGHEADQVPLHIPAVLALEALAFLLLLVVGSVFVAVDERYRFCFCYALGSCVLCKTVSLCSMWQFVNSLAQGPSSAWTRRCVIFFAEAHGVLQTTMLFLLSLGWQIVRADLSHVELRLATLFFGLCMFLCWTTSACDREVPPLDVTGQHELSFALMLYFAKVTSCCGSVLSLNVHQQQLAVEGFHMQVGESTCLSLAQLCMKQKVCERLCHLFLVAILEMISLPCLTVFFSSPSRGRWFIEIFDTAFQGAFYAALAWLVMLLPQRPMPLERFFASV